MARVPVLQTGDKGSTPLASTKMRPVRDGLRATLPTSIIKFDS